MEDIEIFPLANQSVILKVTKTNDQRPGNSRRGKHVVGSTEQQKASQLPETPLGQKPTGLKGFGDWEEVNALFQNREATPNV